MTFRIIIACFNEDNRAIFALNKLDALTPLLLNGFFYDCLTRIKNTKCDAGHSNDRQILSFFYASLSTLTDLGNLNSIIVSSTTALVVFG